jgi:hypothetical protein
LREKVKVRPRDVPEVAVVGVEAGVGEPDLQELLCALEELLIAELDPGILRRINRLIRLWGRVSVARWYIFKPKI